MLCGLYLSGRTTVGEDALVEICEKLLSYPDESGCMPEYMKKCWYFVFSYYSDPVAALDLLEEVFRRERVLQVFTDDEVCWPKECYVDIPSVQGEKDRRKQELLAAAKEKFKDYLK